MLLQGDSGSPLMCENEEGTWTVAGVTAGSAQACDTYTVFTRVAPFDAWIAETMATEFVMTSSTRSVIPPTRPFITGTRRPRTTTQAPTTTRQPQAPTPVN